MTFTRSSVSAEGFFLNRVEFKPFMNHPEVKKFNLSVYTDKMV
jgi:hypothetical protein